MLSKTRGIVLQTVRYGESSMILTVYTRDFGRKSCIVNATRGLKAKNKSAVMQPMFILDLEIYLKKNRELQRIKECRLAEPYLSIPYDIKKSSQAIFLAEVLSKILREEESNASLYAFIENAMIFFDLVSEAIADFHIWFLSGLTEYLGIFPHLGETGKGWFDMKKGIVTDRMPLHPFFMDGETTDLLRNLLLLNINDISKQHTSHKLRIQFLDKILDYYRIHFENFGNINSVAVLKEVFE